MKYLQILFMAHAFADIQRYHDGFKAEFSVINNGRLYNFLFYFENLEFGECVVECIKLIDCVTFNYHSESKHCELTDEEFDYYEADVDAPGWFNYGTHPKVDGGLTDWFPLGPCEACGGAEGKQREIRTCTNPKPRYGGAGCVGDVSRTVTCRNNDPCPINGGLSEWGPELCHERCDANNMQTQMRNCDSPSPQYGGADCVGEKTRSLPCNNRTCSCQMTTEGKCCVLPFEYDGETYNSCGRYYNYLWCAYKFNHQFGDTSWGKCEIIACEGKELKLNCPTDYKIKIITAAYGRSYLEICKKKSMHTQNTNCLSPKSMPVMQRACDGKQNCSFRVSSHKFGANPCKYTHRYLSVQYKCFLP